MFEFGAINWRFLGAIVAFGLALGTILVYAFVDLRESWRDQFRQRPRRITTGAEADRYLAALRREQVECLPCGATYARGDGHICPTLERERGAYEDRTAGTITI